jgi:hypothetical protein
MTTNPTKTNVDSARCAWFIACTNEAAGTLQHPILGAVPICPRCAAKVARLSQTEEGR